MQKRISTIEEIITKQSNMVADQIKHAAKWAYSEEDLRIEVEKALEPFKREVKIPLEGRHEHTVGKGRADSIYDYVVIEYKKPGRPMDNENSQATKEVISQLKQRFKDLEKQEKRKLQKLFGVGCNGHKFIFVRFRNNDWQISPPLDVTSSTTTRFLRALLSLGAAGKPFLPEYLAGDFSSDSSFTQEGVKTFYNVIKTTINPRAKMFFDEWKILFGEVCGYDVTTISDRIKKLSEHYGIGSNPVSSCLLFSIHTYYALFMKLLAAEIISYFNPILTSQIQELQNSPDTQNLLRKLKVVEDGGIYKQLGITNFLEGDLFSWYIDDWNKEIEKIIRLMIDKLAEYDPLTLSSATDESRDLLKKLYQHLFPKSIRHDLGEYYTPDWLAEHVLNSVEYDGHPDKKVLDPACGSGTFLIMAINRIRKYYDEHRDELMISERDLLLKILKNVVGFDLNPLAVMAARTNYIIACKDLFKRVGHIEIPVYLCDSIKVPSEYGEIFAGQLGKFQEVPCSAMKPPTLKVPTEVAKSKEDVAKYTEILERCIKDDYSVEEFIKNCKQAGFKITEELHTKLYTEILNLKKENKNGIWARIIKNSFAPLFVEPVDFIIGNPPWVNWENLPEVYRQSLVPIWRDYYKLFSHKGIKARLGGAKDDLSILMTYVSMDKYLKENGKLGFVITQTLFKTKGGGEGFRKFTIADKTPIKVLNVDDMIDLQPFEDASNWTSVFICQKNKKTEYPVPYFVWLKKPKAKIATDSTLEKIKQEVNILSQSAVPIDSNNINSPWLTGRKDAINIISKAIGKSDYRARAGICGGVNWIYWVDIIKEISKDEVLIKNIADAGKGKTWEETIAIEKALLFPLLRWSDVKRWVYDHKNYILTPQQTSNYAFAIPLPQIKHNYPKTFSYLNKFKNILENRPGYKKFLSGQPFYASYNIGNYTFTKYKTIWRRMDNRINAVVISELNDKIIGKKLLLPQETISFIPFDNSEEAHYVCAIMNSSIVNLVAKSYSVGKSFGSPHILNYIPIARYSDKNKLHQELAEKSQEAHLIAKKGGDVSKSENEIDELTAELWGIQKTELKEIREALVEITKVKKVKSNDEDTDE